MLATLISKAAFESLISKGCFANLIDPLRLVILGVETIQLYDPLDFLTKNPWVLIAFLIMMAAASYIAANITMRKINTRAVYHRSGGTVDILKMRETEDRIIFRTNPDPLTKKAEEITVTKLGMPEIQVSGLKTFRMFHIVEGYGRTVEIRDVIKLEGRTSGSPLATAFSAMATAFELMQKTASKSKSEWMVLVVGLVAAFIAGLGWGIAI